MIGPEPPEPPADFADGSDVHDLGAECPHPVESCAGGICFDCDRVVPPCRKSTWCCLREGHEGKCFGVAPEKQPKLDVDAAFGPRRKR